MNSAGLLRPGHVRRQGRVTLEPKGIQKVFGGGPFRGFDDQNVIDKVFHSIAHIHKVEVIDSVLDAVFEAAGPLNDFEVVSRHPLLAEPLVAQGELEHDATNRPHIHEETVILAPFQDHLGSEEARGPAELSEHGSRPRFDLLAEAKVANLDHAALDLPLLAHLEKDVLRLEVSVANVHGVEVGDGEGNAEDNFHCRLMVHPLEVGGEELEEVLAALLNEEVDVRRGKDDIYEGYDVGVPHLFKHRNLILYPLEILHAVDLVLPHDLHRQDLVGVPLASQLHVRELALA